MSHRMDITCGHEHEGLPLIGAWLYLGRAFQKLLLEILLRHAFALALVLFLPSVAENNIDLKQYSDVIAKVEKSYADQMASIKKLGDR